jgi:putative ABC transport system ATP-binding protein
MIELVQISKTFNAGKSNEFMALREIDLSIEMNGITVFRGPSGSGKTTLLSVVGCMARPTSGRVHLNGRETTSLPERFMAEIRRNTFGFVFQNYHLIRGLTALDNVKIPAYPLGTKHGRLERTALGLLERFHLSSKASEKVERLSGGEQQRVAIARALVNDPSIIIADEPTAHLDTDLCGRFIEIVAGLKAEGKTVLIASHDALVVDSPVVDRVVSMRDGKIVTTEPQSPGATEPQKSELQSYRAPELQNN